MQRMRCIFKIIKILPVIMGVGVVNVVRADIVNDAEWAVKMATNVCGGIADEIADVAGFARANTAVTAVGTVAGGAGVAVGLGKAQIDAEIAELEKQICKAGGCSADSVEKMSANVFWESVMVPMGEIVRLREMQEKSRKMGNWRTGLMAGASATHAASAIISGINLNQSDLVQHVVACNNAIENMRNLYQQMKNQGISPIEFPIRKRMDAIISACDAINVADVEKVEKREKWVLGASVVGGASAIAGTATSASANAEIIRNATDDLIQQKEKKLNTASNVLAGVSTVGSGVATGVNIALVSLTNKMIRRAQQCEDALQQK